MKKRILQLFIFLVTGYVLFHLIRFIVVRLNLNMQYESVVFIVLLFFGFLLNLVITKILSDKLIDS